MRKDLVVSLSGVQLAVRNCSVDISSLGLENTDLY